MQNLGKILIILGLAIIIIGLILMFSGDRLNWFGNLPGDIKVKKENFSFYFPITTMIILSLVISGILWLIRRFL